MSTRYVLLLLVVLFFTGYASAAPSTEHSEIRKVISNVFKVANEKDNSAGSNAKNFDLEMWRNLASDNYALSDLTLTGQVEAALVAYYVFNVNTSLQLATILKNNKLDDIFAKIFMSKEDREKILSMPITFAILSTETLVDGILNVGIQLWPELTGQDQMAQMLFQLRRTDKGMRVTEVKSQDLSLLKLARESIPQSGPKSFADRPQELIDALLEKGFVTNQSLQEYDAML